MKDSETNSRNASNLLKPRKNLPWKQNAPPKTCWARPFLIENRVTRAFVDNINFEENEDRKLLRDQIEGELAGLLAPTQRFWLAEYRFLEKLMTFGQLVAYAPAFVRLTRIMPKKLVFCRRMVVRRYLECSSVPVSPYLSKLRNQFVRSSVLLYPAEMLMMAADKFTNLTLRSADQSAAANRRRVIMLLRSLHMMTDQEICDQFQRESEYIDELHLLSELAHHYRIETDDVFKIPADEINRFWRDEKM
ncbi:MAG: hypothetical protein K9G33_04645 [Sneathiella sp.]|nr:hypothetical protein [Sneathiella sp.]